MTMCEKKPYCNRKIDVCIQSIVDEINKDPNLKTLSSCCGHGIYPGTIVVRRSDGFIFEWYSKTELGKRKCNRYYQKDKEKHYFIPEIVS